MELLVSICLGLGLSAATGFRIFLPALLASIATMRGWIEPSAGYEWLGSWPTFWALLTATAVEIGAYYIPLLDNLLDTIATPTAVIAGTLLSTSFIEVDAPILQWGLGLMMGGGTAGLVQMGTSFLRLGSTGATGGLANPVVATAENTASLTLTIVTLLLPLLAGVVVIILVIWLGRRLLRRRKINTVPPDRQKAG